MEVATCAMCGTSSVAYLFLPHTTVMRCTNDRCELEFTATQPSGPELQTAYHTLYYPSADDPKIAGTPAPVFRGFFNSITHRIGPVQDQTLLDFGCGDGTLCRVAAEFGMVPTGLDFDPNARALLRDLERCETYDGIAKLRELLPAAEFDYIVMWNVIEHLREPWSDLAELRCLLKPAGRLFVATPNARSLKSVVLGNRWDQRLNPTHFYYFHRKSLIEVLRRAGFRHIKEWALSQVYPHHGFVRRGLQRVLASYNLQGQLIFCASNSSLI